MIGCKSSWRVTQDMYNPLSNLRSVADPPLILDISLHAPDMEAAKEHGNHSRILETRIPPNVVETLEKEFRTHGGRILVSRKPPSAFTSCFFDGLTIV